MKHKAAEWLEQEGHGPISELGGDVAHLLDVYLGGIHNARTDYKKIDWGSTYCIVVPWRGGFSTFDYDELTRLVVASHDLMLRVEISPRHFNWVELLFHRRKVRTGETWDRMPTLEEHVSQIRKHCGGAIDASSASAEGGEKP